MQTLRTVSGRPGLRDESIGRALARCAGVDHFAVRLGHRTRGGDRLDPPGSRQPAAIHVCDKVLEDRFSEVLSQTWIAGVGRGELVGVGTPFLHIPFMLATGNSQGCTPFSPQGDIRKVALCRLRHGTRTRRRAAEFVRHESTVPAWGANPVPVRPCRSRPCSPPATPPSSMLCSSMRVVRPL
jgi:hypothetical protein